MKREDFKKREISETNTKTKELSPEKNPLLKLHKEFMKNRASQPQHGKIDAFSFMEETGDNEGFYAVSCVKYIKRRKNKGQELKDLLKAVDYVHLLLQNFLDKRNLTEL